MHHVRDKSRVHCTLLWQTAGLLPLCRGHLVKLEATISNTVHLLHGTAI